mgnify:CR=1 FL=1|tara:strand:- start:1110 stop:2084 length:975 start_codon:yes stop_codon:yes gene_type:complete
MTKAQDKGSSAGDEFPSSITGATLNVDMSGVYFMRAAPKSPFRVSLPPGNFSYGIMVKAGTHLLRVDFPSSTEILLRPGDIVGVSGLAPHSLESEGCDRAEKTGTLDMFEMSVPDDLAAPNRLIIGIAPQETIALSNMIVGPIYVPFDTAADHSRRIWNALRLLDDEAAIPSTDFHHPLIVRRIAEIISLNMTRSLLARHGDNEQNQVGFAASTAILRALRAFLNEPYKPWTVERLASAAGMSRTRFSEEFRRLLGHAPIETISRIRLTMIARQMMASSFSIEDAAFRAGYSSSAAFVRSFQKQFGVSPARWKRQQNEKKNPFD